MNLHENLNLYTDAIRFTAQEMDLPPEYVEKDYWVTYALFSIYQNEIGKDTIFKGGTALSKCYQLIERFSEDIDLVILRREGDSANKLKSSLKKISNTIQPVLPEVEIIGITHKRGMNRKTAHNYEKVFKGDYGQVRDVIVLESTWLGYFEPYTTKSIVSFVGKMMLDNDQSETAKAHGLLPFDVFSLQPERTICEKIMSLVRFSYGENPIEDLGMKIRHAYDLHFLIKNKELKTFFDSEQFEEMLYKVANDDVISFKNNNKWLKHHPVEALIFKETEAVWEKLKPTYNVAFKDLVYGKFPPESDILKTLKQIQSRLEKIAWDIKP